MSGCLGTLTLTGLKTRTIPPHSSYDLHIGQSVIDMEVIIELSPENAHRFQMQDESTPAISQLTTTIDALNIIIKPQYRDEDDTTSDYFFVLDIRDRDECQRIATMRDQLPAVKAAYCKAEAEPAFLP